MFSMAAVAMEQVQQRAGREEEEGPVLEHVRAVLGDQEESRDREKRPEHPAASAAGTTVLVRMLTLRCHSFTRRRRSALVTTETELIAMAAPAKIGESSTPNTG